MAKEKIMAKVGDVKITEGLVEEFIHQMEEGDRFDNPQGKAQIADELVNQELLYIDAKKNKLDQDPEYIEEVEEMKSNMLKNYAMHVLFKDIRVTERELRDYYDANKEHLLLPQKFRAGHILVDSEEKAEGILNEIHEGLSFEDAARKYSMDTSGQNGGDLGEFPEGTMVPEFEKALKELEEGEISQPVKSQFGYHLIKLYHSHPKRIPEFEEIEQSLSNTLYMIKRQEKYLKKTAEISKEVEVEKYY